MVLSRAIWIATALFSTGLFIASVPARYKELVEPSASLRQGLTELGMSARFYAAYHVGLEIAFATAFTAIAVLIFWRKHQEWIALFLSYMLMLFGTSAAPVVQTMGALASAQPHWMPAIRFLINMTWTAVFLFFCIFPDGRFVPRWTRGFALFCALINIPWNLFPDWIYSPWKWHIVPFMALELGVWGTCVYVQVYRYMHTSDQMMRQQTKWVVLGGVASILGNLTFYLPRFLFPQLRDLSIGSSLFYDTVSITAMYLFSLLTPLSIAISILRYKLWDINVLIGRTLVYVPLTGIVGGLYSATLVLSQKMFVAITGEQSDVAIVLSTLVLASTFTPIKNGLQSIVDRRFKDHLKPEHQLDEFGNKVLSVLEVSNPHDVARRLLDEAIKAFGAKSGAVYLDGDGTEEPFHTYGDWKDENTVVEVPLEEDGDHLGVLKLGARRDGSRYSEAEVNSLQYNAEVVARAIELATYSLRPHSHPHGFATSIHEVGSIGG